MERTSKNIKNEIIKVDRKAVSHARNLKTDAIKNRKASVNQKPFGRGNTTKQKPTPHFISITGSDRNKLEFPIKLNRK
jgi:hypothetical protein